MAYINVAEWKPVDVTAWLKGLDDSMYNYVNIFTDNDVGGRQLLHIRPYELEQLGIKFIGHQEIVLEAVENLRNFYYNLDKENLQFMALHVATAARSLHRQLSIHSDPSKIETQILNDITRTIATIKPLISWLDRFPFQGQHQFTEISHNMLRRGLEMATIAHRDRFAIKPVQQIRDTAQKLENLANYIIQDITDPMVLQPASLNVVNLKKRESELGFEIEPSFHGIHRITDIKYNSPAHNSGKIEDGDEIVQINYQTVVGWQYNAVLRLLRRSLPDVILTLKKRPKHTKIYGQIYMQPYRLPSKKRAMGSRWDENVPSPRAGLLTVPNAFDLPIPLKNNKEEKSTAVSSDTDSSCSDTPLTPTDSKVTEKERRLYYPKPRAMLQRRYTICGDELLSHKSAVGIPLWHERKVGLSPDPSSPSLRDKSVSFGFGLDSSPRPTTCIGIATGNSSKPFISDVKNIFSETKKLRAATDLTNIEEKNASSEEKSKAGVSKVVRFDANMKYENYHQNEKYMCNVENTILETFEPIPFADEEDEDQLLILRNVSSKAEDIIEVLGKVSQANKGQLIEAINMPIVLRRGRLDKSHSTPTYDISGEESDTPPAIEPRREFLTQAPPKPPPRPRKQKDCESPNIPPPPPKPTNKKPPKTLIGNEATYSADQKNEINTMAASKQMNASVMSHDGTLPGLPLEENELHTPVKTKTLTLKKKHSLIAKRRNVNLKVLGTGEIQGHLYRRTKHRGVTFWARVYFVMIDTILYGFKSKDATKANCLIFLPGFTVSLATEVHSKPFAFKVYHSTKSFYFAAESQDALHQWVDFIRQATLQLHQITENVNSKELFSETDSSSDENESVIMKNLCTPSPQNSKDASTSFLSGIKTSNSNLSTKNDRRYLGSLRKFTKGTLPFKSSSTNEKKVSSDIPVPTEQYRSYRKVPGGSFGIQIGTNTPGYHNNENSLPTFTEQINRNLKTSPEISPSPQLKFSLSLSRTSIVSTTETIVSTQEQQTSQSTQQVQQSHSFFPMKHSRDKSFESPSKGIKKIPYNFIHASNPNLVEFDFQTSKTLDYSLPKINAANSWDAHQNVQGFVTLKDLMLQKQEEEAQDMYNNRVLLGVEKKDERKRNLEHYGNDKNQDVNTRTRSNQQYPSDSKMSKTQNRSLPKTPDYEISFNPDDEDIKRTRTKEGLKLRDFGYELISGDEPIGRMTTIRQNSNISTSSNESQSIMKTSKFLKSHKNKKNSISSCSSSAFDFCTTNRGDSFKKKGKLEAFKMSSERIFQINKHSGMTMTLPLNKKSNKLQCSQTQNNIDGHVTGIKKSYTYNNDLKENASAKYEAHRKNSAPMPIFSKLSFSASGSTHSNKPVKENKVLSSPLLFHRTTLGGNQHHCDGNGRYQQHNTCTEREYDREIFSQVILPNIPSHYDENNARYKYASQKSASNASITAPDVIAPPPPTSIVSSTAESPCPLPRHERSDTQKSTTSTSNAATPEYPNMECPPVFEPEIYSLTDSNASLSLLLRRNTAVTTTNEDEKR